jgi:hypothetical protein
MAEVRYNRKEDGQLTEFYALIERDAVDGMRNFLKKEKEVCERPWEESVFAYYNFYDVRSLDMLKVLDEADLLGIRKANPRTNSSDVVEMRVAHSVNLSKEEKENCMNWLNQARFNAVNGCNKETWLVGVRCSKKTDLSAWIEKLSLFENNSRNVARELLEGHGRYETYDLGNRVFGALMSSSWMGKEIEKTDFIAWFSETLSSTNGDVFGGGEKIQHMKTALSEKDWKSLNLRLVFMNETGHRVTIGNSLGAQVFHEMVSKDVPHLREICLMGAEEEKILEKQIEGLVVSNEWNNWSVKMFEAWRKQEQEWGCDEGERKMLFIGGLMSIKRLSQMALRVPDHEERVSGMKNGLLQWVGEEESSWYLTVLEKATVVWPDRGGWVKEFRNQLECVLLEGASKNSNQKVERRKKRSSAL